MSPLMRSCLSRLSQQYPNRGIWLRSYRQAYAHDTPRRRVATPGRILALGAVIAATYLSYTQWTRYRTNVLVFPTETRRLLRQALLLQQERGVETRKVAQLYRLAYEGLVSSGIRIGDDHAVGVLLRWIEATLDDIDTELVGICVAPQSSDDAHVGNDVPATGLKELASIAGATLHELIHRAAALDAKSLTTERWIVTLSFQLANLHRLAGNSVLAERIYLQTLGQVLKGTRMPRAGNSVDPSSSIDKQAKALLAAISPHQDPATVLAALDQLARLYVSSNRARDAFEVLRRVERMLPDDDIRLAHTRLSLVSVCWDMGDVKGARWWILETQRCVNEHILYHQPAWYRPWTWFRGAREADAVAWHEVQTALAISQRTMLELETSCDQTKH